MAAPKFKQYLDARVPAGSDIVKRLNVYVILAAIGPLGYMDTDEVDADVTPPLGT